MSAETAHYHPIQAELLGKNFSFGFELYYKSSGGESNFVKFASKNPTHKEKVLQLLESGDLQEDLYILEEDLNQYYEIATQSLRKVVLDPKVPVQEKMGKVYDVSQNIMKDFFKHSASDAILKNSEQVMDMMTGCLSTSQMGFHGISEILCKDYYTYTHSVNVGLYCMTYGTKVKMPPNDVRDLGVGGMLHDVGKTKIAEEIINKNGKLTEVEFEEIKKHAAWGEEMIKGMGCFGANVWHMAGMHHEKYDGTGYPNGIAKDEIARNARLCKIMDVYDALTTKRSYKRAMKPIQALTIMKEEMTGHFDPALLISFIRLMGPGA